MRVKNVQELLGRLVPADLRADPAGRRGYWFYLAHLFTIFGIALSNLFYGLTGVWLWRHRRELPGVWPRLVPLAAPALAYAVFLAVSVLASHDPASSAGELKEILSLGTLLIAPLVVRGVSDVRRIFDALVWLTGLVAVYGLAQYFLGDYGSLDRRIPGPFSHYMTFAGVLLVGDFLILGRLFTGGHRRLVNWGVLALVNLTLLITLTRGSWVALALVTTAYAAFRARRLLLIFVAAGILTLTLAPDSWRERVSSIGDLRDPSNYDRLCMVDAGLYMIGEKPLFGLGPGMVAELYPIYRQPTAPRFTVPHLHNTFLHLGAERGLLSLGAYLWLMAAGLWILLRAYRAQGGSRGPRGDLYLGALMAILGFNLAGLFEANWNDTEVQRLVLFLLAVPACLGPEATLSETVTPTENEDE